MMICTCGLYRVKAEGKGQTDSVPSFAYRTGDVSLFLFVSLLGIGLVNNLSWKEEPP